MRAWHALLLLLCAATRSALAEYSDLIQPVPLQEAATPHRQLLADGNYGYGSYAGSYGYGGYSETAHGSRRHLLMADASGSYGYGGSYGYAGYGSYGGSYGRRRLAEIDFGLQPRDVLLEYAEQKQEQQEAMFAKLQDSAHGLSAAAAAALQQAHSSKRGGLSVPIGQCYCRYDVDFTTWALAEDVCKQALYERCKTEAGLPCAWLDKFYAPAAGPAHNLPHEKDIATFLHEDCSPQPPCACTGLKFDGSDAVPLQVGCCRDLRVACKTPFSGICCKKVAAFCSDDQAIPMLAAWTAHNLHHGDCSSYEGLPYKFVPYRDMLTAAAAKQQQQQQGNTAEEKLLKQALTSMEQPAAAAAAAGGTAIYGLSPKTLMIAAAGSICVAVVAVIFAMIKHTGDHTYDALDRDDDESNDDLGGHTNLNICPTDGNGRGCCEHGVAGGCGSNACLSRVVSVSTMSTGSGVREPLLHSHSSNTISRPVSTASGLYRTCGDYMPRSPSQMSLDNMS